jgi:hypothetical protein
MRPSVGIVYSDGELESLESFHLAKYLCGILTATNHAVVHLVPMSDECGSERLSPNASRINYYPLLGAIDKTRVHTVPGADFQFTTWAVLPICDVILVVVNRSDSIAAWERVGGLRFAKDHPACIFCLERGLLNFAHVTDAATALRAIPEHNKVTVVPGMASFSVVPHPESHAMMPVSVGAPTIVLERLTKDAESIATGPCNLLEFTGMRALYRKTLTPYSWGMTCVEAAVGAANVLQGSVSTRVTLRDRLFRTAAVCMVREMGVVTARASKKSKWDVSVDGVSALPSLWAVEMVLSAPNWLLAPCLWWGALAMDVPLPSPGAVDGSAGRKSALLVLLTEVLDLGRRTKTDMPVCSYVTGRLRVREEAGIFTAGAVGNERPALVDAVFRRGREPASLGEFRGYSIRFAALLSSLIVFYILFFHD